MEIVLSFQRIGLKEHRSLIPGIVCDRLRNSSLRSYRFNGSLSINVCQFIKSTEKLAGALFLRWLNKFGLDVIMHNRPGTQTLWSLINLFGICVTQYGLICSRRVSLMRFASTHSVCCLWFHFVAEIYLRCVLFSSCSVCGCLDSVIHFNHSYRCSSFNPSEFLNSCSFAPCLCCAVPLFRNRFGVIILMCV